VGTKLSYRIQGCSTGVRYELHDCNEKHGAAYKAVGTDNRGGGPSPGDICDVRRLMSLLRSSIFRFTASINDQARNIQSLSQRHYVNH
jgi:hypothetical protein